MARLFVFNDNLTARVELVCDPEDGIWSAYCAGCRIGSDDLANDLLNDSRERFSFEDSEQVAERHADSCQRCADPRLPDRRPPRRGPPLPQAREEPVMTTVPNWIAKGYVYSRPRGLGPGRVYPITSWRPTVTQVVITAEGLRGEARFRLADLREVGQCDRPLILIAPTDERVSEVQRAATVANAIGTLKAAMDERLQSDMDAEELVLAIGRVQRAATKALAELADLL